MPALKFARGEPFKEEHWIQVLRKLGIPKSVKLETLTVGHFLDVLNAVHENVSFLKEITSRAQGEVLIREALQELKAWSDTVLFCARTHAAVGRELIIACVCRRNLRSWSTFQAPHSGGHL